MKQKNINKRVKSKGTKLELLTRKIIRSMGIRYLCNVKGLEGKPDIVIPKERIAIYVNGCFWHKHQKNCKISKIPEKNKEFWERKLKENTERDERNQKILERKGWKVVVFWECEIKSREKVIGLYMMEKLENYLVKEY